MHLSDEDYLAFRASSRRLRPSGDSTSDSDSTSRAELKSWLVTAKLMYPNKFEIQFEAYAFEKEDGNAESAAKCLMKLYENFANVKGSEKLWSEIEAIAEVLSTPGREECFQAQIFKSLPDETQRDILMSAAYHTNDVIERCKKMLLAFKRFPDIIPKYGESDCLAFVIGECKQRLRKPGKSQELLSLLITEIVPLLIPVTSLKLNKSMLHDIVLLTFELIFAHGDKKVELESPISWPCLIQNFEHIGQRLGWTIANSLSSMEVEDALGLFISINSFYQANRDGMTEVVQDQVFFVSSLLFFKALSLYMSEMFTNSNNGDSDVVDEVDHDALLVEAFITYEGSEAEPPQLKRRRTTEDERKIPVVTHTDLGELSPVVKSFLLAVRYFDLIRNDPALDARLTGQVRTPDAIFLPFYIDLASYQGRYREAASSLRHITSLNPSYSPIKYHVKMASLNYALGDQHSMAEQALQAMDLMTKQADNGLPNAKNPVQARQGRHLTQPTLKMRHMKFVQYNRQSLTSYCTRLLIIALKDRALQPTASNDYALGHVISLIQYCYPEETDLFFLLMHRIRMKDSFSYPIFCNHVVVIDILEEFSHLMSDPTTQVTLDITPFTGGGAGSTPSRRVGTRGANRGEKNEIRSAIKKQVARCYENLDDTIADFVTKNRDSVIQCLL